MGKSLKLALTTDPLQVLDFEMREHKTNNAYIAIWSHSFLYESSVLCLWR